MTIAVGFRCHDGVVIAADSQYSQDISKTAGQKIFPIPSNGHYAVTIGGVGATNQIKWAVTEIKRSLAKEIGNRSTEVLEIQRIIETVLGKSYSEHVDPAPEEQRMWLEYGLLIGIWTSTEGAKLFRSHRNTMDEVENPNHITIGIGSCLGEFILDALFDRTWMLLVDEAASVAVYIVNSAKNYVEYCGGSTFVRVLTAEGNDLRLRQEEIVNAEEYFKGLFRWTSSMRSHLSRTVKPEDIDMAPYADILKDHVLKFRKTQDHWRAWLQKLITENQKQVIK